LPPEEEGKELDCCCIEMRRQREVDMQELRVEKMPGCDRWSWKRGESPWQQLFLGLGRSK